MILVSIRIEAIDVAKSCRIVKERRCIHRAIKMLFDLYDVCQTERKIFRLASSLRAFYEDLPTACYNRQDDKFFYAGSVSQT